jgi:hypothetical protein
MSGTALSIHFRSLFEQKKKQGRPEFTQPCPAFTCGFKLMLDP